ncbi:hypothetical protein ACFL0W_04375 [Nanoarchaeota archaeon]
MKKISMVLIGLLIILSSVNVAFSVSNEIYIGKILTTDAMVGRHSEFTINLEKKVSHDLENVRVIVFIPELAIRVPARSFDFEDKSDIKKVLVELPQNIQPRDYYAVIYISNDDVRRVLHRIVRVN